MTALVGFWRVCTLKMWSKAIVVPAVFMLLIIAALMPGHTIAGEVPAQTLHKVTVETSDGQVVCNSSAAFSQVAERSDYFIGRGWGIGTIEQCHDPRYATHSFIALFKMDWQRYSLVFQHYLLLPPITASAGLTIRSAYDPDVGTFNGETWVAFECVIPDKVSACVAPLTADMSKIDTSRLSDPVIGVLGREGPEKKIVATLSASAPTLLSWHRRLFLYWQIDPFDNANPNKPLVTRAMELRESSAGKLWGLNSGDQPVITDDPSHTVLTNDVSREDDTLNHVALVSYLQVVNGTILEIGSVGGTRGGVCRSTHDRSVGCWRMRLTTISAPLSSARLNERHLGPTKLPENVIEYPRLIVDPKGQTLLMGLFEKPPPASDAEHGLAVVGTGLGVIPINITELMHDRP